VPVTETQCVYCAVRTECIYVIQVNFNLERVKNRTSFSSCLGVDWIH
jgi:hypothetical protein